MEKWSGKGKFVVMTTQVANEGSNMTVYEVGKKVKQDFNMIEAYDMTLEAVITKLMWLKRRTGYAESILHADQSRYPFYKERIKQVQIKEEGFRMNGTPSSF